MQEEDDADRALRRLKRSHGAEAGEVLALIEAAARNRPGPKKKMRAHALGRALRRAAELAQACDWHGAALVRDGRVIVEVEGVRFYADRDDEFFRGGGGSPARRLLHTAQVLGLELRTIFDVGANIGEFALHFARKAPQARVFAFEPAPENIEAFEANLALQTPPLTNLQLVREAVSDRRGEIEMLVGVDKLDTLMVEASLERLEARGPVERRLMPTDTLEGYCRRFGVEQIDLLKIDIEGAEPLLSQSIAALAGRIGAAYVEISAFNTVEAYVRLAEAFAAGGLAMATSKREPIADPPAWIRDLHAQGATHNAWFLPA
jgi:FkbM family methyltransferase